MKLKELFYDIETSPIIGYTWGIWETDVIKVITDWQILSVAWKWAGERSAHVLGQDDLPGYVPGTLDDRGIVEFIHGLFDTADIVVAHNGDQFDARKVRARMMAHGMAPPAPYKQIDTKKLAKKYAAFTSNKLADLSRDLGVTRKGDPGGFETWEGCLAGDPKAWARMKRYNRQDIAPLEDLYERLRPWMDNHPSVALIEGNDEACPKCGKGPMQKRGASYTKVGIRQRYQCTSCWGWSQGRFIERREVAYVN